MSELRKTTPDDLYFVTLSVVGWVDLFSRETYKNIIVENLKYCQDKEKLQIFSYVIMSNHLHLICYSKEPFLLSDLEEILIILHLNLLLNPINLILLLYQLFTSFEHSCRS